MSVVLHSVATCFEREGERREKEEGESSREKGEGKVEKEKGLKNIK